MSLNHKIEHLLLALLIVGMTFTAGCKSMHPEVKPDSKIERLAENAEEAFSMGYDQEAIEDYLAAVKRAWLLDDPTEIGHNAYNMAVCLSSIGRYLEARDWLVEARMEYQRVGINSPNVWLLEAKIARRQGFLDEATYLASRGVAAAQCHEDEKEKKDKKGFAAKVSKGVDHFTKHSKKLTECRDEKKQLHYTKAESSLIQANLACDQSMLDYAWGHLDDARTELQHLDEPDLEAEAERVQGRIHMYESAPEFAGPRFDNEAVFLREAKNYREIPFAYRSAGEAYEAAGFIEIAAERYYFVARIMYARDDYVAALRYIERAIPFAEAGPPHVQARLALLFKVVSDAMDAESDTKKDPSDELETESSELVPAEEVEEILINPIRLDF